MRVLDEWGRIDVTVGEHGESARTVREKVETARALESLPAVAAAAHAGELSVEQLGSVVKLADEESDAEWAARAPNVAPADLARLARSKSTPSVEDARARREARGLRMWWQGDMLHLRGQLPDLMGARFEATITRMADRMKPVTGQPWGSREHRNADALDELGERFDAVEAPTAAAKPLLVVEVPLAGPAEIAGVPIADSVVEALRANARVEPVLVDDRGVRIAVGRRTTALSAKFTRAVLLRDGHCRMPGCEMRHGLDVHHLRPRSWGGTDDIANLAAVCRTHHAMLVPTGRWALVGNPNQPDGLTILRADEMRAPPCRAGPTAA